MEYSNGDYTEFTLEKRHSKIEEMTLAPSSIDIIYYDAFAPESQPHLWQEDIMRSVLSWLKPGGYLLTYCAKGSFRRTCKALGCRLESLPGPPGKREISRFVKKTKHRKPIKQDDATTNYARSTCSIYARAV